MKQIGYTADRTEWYSEIPGDDVEWTRMFIVELRENINAETWEQIGWIYPAEQLNNTPPFTIATGEKPSTNAIAAFIMRPQIETAGPNSPVKRSEFDDMVKKTKAEFAALRANVDELAAFAEQVDKTLELFAKQLANRRELDNVPPADAMTFYDHAFIAAWSALGESYSEADAIRHAHGIAATLTAARRPATGA